MRRKGLESSRRDIIRGVVYEGVSINDMADRYGVDRTTISRNLSSWGVSIPVHLSGFPQYSGWFELKQKAAKNLPAHVRNMNRSSLVEFYSNKTREDFCRILNISTWMFDRTLEYHCIKKRSRKEGAHASNESCRGQLHLAQAQG
ncbi:MAG: hypothetical protein WC455_09475 [Dehalococcoidia bacterium]